MKTVIAAWCYLGNKHKMKVLLVTSSAGNWIIPKGQVEKRLCNRKVALEEAWEEGGIKGKITGSSKSFMIKRNGKVKWKFFPIKIIKMADFWPEQDYRHRQLVKPKKVTKIIKNRDLARAIRRMRNSV